MTVDELIEQLQALPFESRRLPVSVGVASDNPDDITYMEYSLDGSRKVEKRGNTIILPASSNGGQYWHIRAIGVGNEA